jgi:hypothetical protein
MLPTKAYVSIHLLPEDIVDIRKGIRAWGKPDELAVNYDSKMLSWHLRLWARFVEQDWSGWDISEYSHDVGVRIWIQVAIEHCTPATRARIVEIVEPLDRKFMARMHPVKSYQFNEVPALSNQPYFWEVNAIHPDLVR